MKWCSCCDEAVWTRTSTLKPKRSCGRRQPTYPLGAVEYSLLPQLGVLIARAPAQLIRWLIMQPAVVVASANRVADSADGAPLAGHASNVLRSTPVGQECAALKDELAHMFGRMLWRQLATLESWNWSGKAAYRA